MGCWWLSMPIVMGNGWRIKTGLAVDAKKPLFFNKGFRVLAEWTGLEPATPGVTGRYSNQLNYHSLWWVMTESNRRHPACKAGALPTELITLPVKERIKSHPILFGK